MHANLLNCFKNFRDNYFLYKKEKKFRFLFGSGFQNYCIYFASKIWNS